MWSWLDNNSRLLCSIFDNLHRLEDIIQKQKPLVQQIMSWPFTRVLICLYREFLYKWKKCFRSSRKTCKWMFACILGTLISLQDYFTRLYPVSGLKRLESCLNFEKTFKLASKVTMPLAFSINKCFYEWMSCLIFFKTSKSWNCLHGHSKSLYNRKGYRSWRTPLNSQWSRTLLGRQTPKS